MASLIAVAGIDTGAYQAMPDVIAGFQGGLDIRAIEWININGLVRILLDGRLHKSIGDVIIVGAAGILGAD